MPICVNAVQECDATDDDSSTIARNIKIFIPYQTLPKPLLRRFTKRSNGVRGRLQSREGR